MAYGVLAEATMVAHFCFLAFLVGGGFVASRVPHLIWPHLAAAGWGFAAVAGGLGCPLTALESWGRRMAGGDGLRAGFIDTYIEGVVYPESYGVVVQGFVLAAVVASWLPQGVRLLSRCRAVAGARRRRGTAGEPARPRRRSRVGV